VLDMTGHDHGPRSAQMSHELAWLRGRPLGTCTTCGEAVFAAESFTRYGGHVAHVRCAVAARVGHATAPVAPSERSRWR
jgi:hypothetical protein